MGSAKKETSEEERQTRLRLLLERLRTETSGSVLLDLCDVIVLVAEGVDGSFKFDHPRVLVHIRQKREAERLEKKRRGDGG